MRSYELRLRQNDAQNNASSYTSLLVHFNDKSCVHPNANVRSFLFNLVRPTTCRSYRLRYTSIQTLGQRRSSEPSGPIYSDELSGQLKRRKSNP